MPVASVYENGGIIGQTLDFGSTEQYIAGTTVATPSFVGGVGTTNRSNTLSLTGITGLQEGDLVIVARTSDTSDEPVTSIGWTPILQTRPNSIGTTLAYKVMGATPDTSVSFADQGALSAVAFRGVEYTLVSAVVSTSSSTVDPNSVTATDDNSVVIVFSGLDDDDNSSISSAPTGYTVGATGNGDGSNAFMYKTGVSVGTEDPSSLTWSSPDALDAYTILLNRTTVTAYGNFKNSGIWNLNAVYSYFAARGALINRNLILHLDASNSASYSGTGTTWTDLSSSGNNGTLTNGPTYTYPYIEFDGDNDYVELGTIATSNPLQLSSPADNGITISFAAWMNGPSAADNYQRIVDKSDSTISNNGWAIYDNSTSTTPSSLIFSFGNTNTQLSTGVTPTYSSWQIWTLTWNSSTGAWVWYLNGSSIASGTQTYAILNVQTNMRLATWNHSTARELSGRLGYIMIHESVLDSDEVLNNFNYYKNIYGIS